MGKRNPITAPRFRVTFWQPSVGAMRLALAQGVFSILIIAVRLTRGKQRWCKLVAPSLVTTTTRYPLKVVAEPWQGSDDRQIIGGECIFSSFQCRSCCECSSDAGWPTAAGAHRTSDACSKPC